MRILALLATVAVASAADSWVVDLGGRSVADAAGQVTEISLRSTWVTDGDLLRLSTYPKLRKLDLSRTHIDDRALDALKSLRLTELDLTYAEHISDVGLSKLRGIMTLESLSLEGTKVTDSGMNSIASLANLRSLNLRCTQITDSALEQLESLEKLEELAIGGNRIAGFGLAYLEGLPALKRLDLSGSQLTDDGVWSVALTDLNIRTIAGLGNLESLNLASSDLLKLDTIPDGGIREVATIRVTDLGVEQLAALRRLRSLDLTRSKVTVKGLSQVAQLSGLEYLSLAYVDGMDDASLAPLQRLHHLKVLDLSGAKVTDRGLETLRRALPNCKLMGR